MQFDMLDGVTLDQLRTFIAIVDAGSFSAAGRRLRRAQSVVSQTVANLEAQLGVRLFDRVTRLPVLTKQGRALLAEARAVADSMDAFKASASFLAGGLEPELSVVVDVMFPIGALTAAVGAFQAEFPAVPLRLYVEALGGVIQPVLDGRCAFGIMGSFPLPPAAMTIERLLRIRLMPVASPRHALAAAAAPIGTAVLDRHVQLVLTDPSSLTDGRDFGVFSSKTWRLADLGAKHAFLKAGLGWGSMPAELVAPDLADGSLVPLVLEDMPPDMAIVMSAVYPAGSPPGPAGRWLIERLISLSKQCPADRHDAPLTEPAIESTSPPWQPA